MPRQRDAFDPADFLTIARTTASLDTEAALRTAVSRAYYSAFHVAKSYTGVGRAFGGNSIHWEVSAALKSMHGAVGEMLEELLRLRKVADYQLLPNRRDDRDWRLNWRLAAAMATHVILSMHVLES